MFEASLVWTSFQRISFSTYPRRGRVEDCIYTPRSHFEYLVLQFWHTNAPAVFEALINDILRCFLNQCIFVYSDNI